MSFRDFALVVTLFLGCNSCSSNELTPTCPIEIIGLSLDDPSRIAGTWRWAEARMDDCTGTTRRGGELLRFRIADDSVFVIQGTFEEGITAYNLQVREGVLGGYFLDMAGYVILLSLGDTLIVDARYRDLSQGLFVRE